MSLTAFIGRCPHCGHDHGENSLFDVARGTLTPSQQAKVNEQFANYAKQKPHLYGGCDEITTLREQVEKLTKERETEIARNRPLQSLIKSQEEIKSFLLKKSEENKEAVKQLDSERQANALLTEELAALAEQNEKFRETLSRWRYQNLSYNWCCGNCGAVDGDEHKEGCVLSLPNLTSPMLNRIRAEAYREAAEIAGPEDSYQDQWFKAKSDSCAKLRAKADELEQSK